MYEKIVVPPGVRESQWLSIARRQENTWKIPERDASGKVVGASIRHADGTITHPQARGLVYVHPLPPEAGSNPTEPVLICEGATDTAAMMSLGFDAIGIPGPGSCIKWLAQLTGERHAVIVTDTPEADHVAALAETLAVDCRSVRVVAPILAGSRGDYDAAIQRAEPIEAPEVVDSITTESPLVIAPTTSRTIDEGALDLDTLTATFPTVRPPVIDGMLRRGEVMNVIAAPKVGKSWLIHALALSVATGRDWLGFPTERGPVLLIDAELHPETLASRLRSVRQTSGIHHTETPDLRIRSVRGQRVTIDEIAAQAATTPTPYRLIILDAMYRFLTGEENSNEDMTRVYNALDSIARSTGAAIVVVHHTSKGVQSDKAVTDVGSGAGAQSRAADTHLAIRHHEQDQCVVVDGVVRSFPAFDPFVIRFLYPGWELAPELDPAALKRPAAGKSDKPTQDAANLNAAFLAALPTSGPGITLADIGGRWQGEPPPARAIAKIAAEGVRTFRWSRSGSGRANDPYRYHPRADFRDDAGGLPI